jgi:hypothetical protein
MKEWHEPPWNITKQNMGAEIQTSPTYGDVIAILGQENMRINIMSTHQEPKLPPPDPDPERDSPEPSPVREPEEPEPDLVDPNPELLPA